MGTPDIAAAHFAAIVAMAAEARARIDAAADADPGEDQGLFIDADETCEALLALILDAPGTPKVMLALAGAGQSGPAGAA